MDKTGEKPAPFGRGIDEFEERLQRARLLNLDTASLSREAFEDLSVLLTLLGTERERFEVLQEENAALREAMQEVRRRARKLSVYIDPNTEPGTTVVGEILGILEESGIGEDTEQT